MHNLYIMQHILLLDFLLAAVYQDLRCDRVDNTLIAAGWGCGVSSALMNSLLLKYIAERNTGQSVLGSITGNIFGNITGNITGGIGMAASLAGGILPILLLWWLFRFRMLGAGDIKLLSVCGTFLGWRGSLRAVILSIFCGGIIAAALILIRGNFRSRVRYFLTYLSQYLQDQTIRPYRRKETKEAEFHFTLAILCGVVITLGTCG